MSVLYLTEQGSRVTKTGDRVVVVSEEGKELLETECRHLESVLLFGNVQVTTQALAEMLEHGIELALLSYSGRLRGQLTPPRPRNIDLRLRQYRLATSDDTGLALSIACQIVAEKIRGGAAVLRADLKNNPDDLVRQCAATLETASISAESAASFPTLLGIEGSSARAYFEALGRCCRGQHVMQGRSSRPPRDPMNALLSFGYTLLGQEITSLLDAIGLDPYIGLYHVEAHGRPALALDLLEEFRHPCVDRFALNLNNLRILKTADFEPNADGGWRMTRDALKRFFAEWETWLNTPRALAPGLPPCSWRKGIQTQAERLARVIRGGNAFQGHSVPETTAPDRNPQGEVQC